MLKNFLLIFFCLGCSLVGLCSNVTPIKIETTIEKYLIGDQVLTFSDPSNSLSAEEIMDHMDQFNSHEEKIINWQIDQSSHWIYFTIENQTQDSDLAVEIEIPNLDLVMVHEIKPDNSIELIGLCGQNLKFEEREYLHPNPIFSIEIEQFSSKTFLIKIENSDQTSIPLFVGSKSYIIQELSTYDIIYGIFIGIYLVMFLYNLFLLFITKEPSYYYYSLYVGFVFLGQIALAGYGFKYIWPDNIWLEKRTFIFAGGTVAISALLFMDKYLSLKSELPIAHKLTICFIFSYLLTICVAIFSIPISLYILNGLSISILFTLIVAIIMTIRGYRLAKIFLLAWSCFLVGLLVFFLKDFGILPYNNITTKMMNVGAVIEVVLLSFALGEIINRLRSEKRDLMHQQNIVLEEQVQIRTRELSSAINKLKETQSQLVDAEKMASLGQLTAGIAHEINNPINFVSANITSLDRDVADLIKVISKVDELIENGQINNIGKKEIATLKKELDLDYTIEEIGTLLIGMKKGADRTTEIVSGLKMFSHLESADLKEGNINDGIRSTTMILKSKMNGIKLEEKYGNVKDIYSLHGQVNQVFMNLLDNAIHACKAKKYTEKESPSIKITTSQSEKITIIIISDNGIGMSEETKNKIFEPFFTTKKVGDGTGLGMSIVHGIIQKLNAELKITSQIGEGTEIVINLLR